MSMVYTCASCVCEMERYEDDGPVRRTLDLSYFPRGVKVLP